MFLRHSHTHTNKGQDSYRTAQQGRHTQILVKILWPLAPYMYLGLCSPMGFRLETLLCPDWLA